MLGHRGVRGRGSGRLSFAAPTENSLAAFEYALAQGCDGFEFDLRQTRDGRNVLWHDPKLNGKEIGTTDFADLKAGDGSLLACLEEVLQQFGHRAYLDIEIKVAGSEESVAAALKRGPPRRGYVLSSFLPQVLLRMHDLDEEMPLGFICERATMMNRWRELPIRIFLPRQELVTLQWVEEVHRHGKQIMTWTVNSARQMQAFADWSVDGLISDDPQLLSQTFGASLGRE
jgi:glycerophosphoryl diester phosphodiesterase